LLPFANLLAGPSDTRIVIANRHRKMRRAFRLALRGETSDIAEWPTRVGRARLGGRWFRGMEF